MTSVSVPSRPFRMPAPRLFRPEQLERLHEAAVRILLQQGIRVHHEPARETAARAGMRAVGDRVFPDRDRIDALLARTRSGDAEEGAETQAESDPVLWLSVPKYCEFIHDLDTDEVVPITTESLTEATKLVDAMGSLRVTGSGPGIPHDVPPLLQRLQQYRISATYSREGYRPDMEEGSPRVFPYLVEMAEALGHPVRGHTIYVISPLSLGRWSFESMEKIGRGLESVHVSNMLSAGGSAPIELPAALALAVAESLGSAAVVETYTKLPVYWSVRVCPLDPRTMALSLGGPEEFLFQRASDEVNAWYHGWAPGAPNGMVHTQSKLPDAQAAAEKMSQLTLAATCGARYFSGAGALSLDEIFSAEQLVVDCELRDHVQRLIRGVELDCDPAACAAEVQEGLEAGFLGLESAARLYRQVYWLPRLFERRGFGGWQEGGKPRLSGRAREIARELRRQHEFELEADTRRKLDAIYARAERELAG